MAPELLEGKRYTNKVDVYSFGMCIWETVVRLKPEGGYGMVALAIRVRKEGGRERMPKWMK